MQNGHGKIIGGYGYEACGEIDHFKNDVTALKIQTHDLQAHLGGLYVVLFTCTDSVIGSCSC
jgi:hypothetical protein